MHLPLNPSRTLLRALFSFAAVIAAITLFIPAQASAQTELNAGCDVTISWEVGGADTVATVDILVVDESGDTLLTLATATANDGEETVAVPCSEPGSTEASLRVIANNDPPFFLRDDDVTLVSEAPSVAALADDAVVDSTCTADVAFSATIEDDCGVDADSVMVSAILVEGAATIGEPDFSTGDDEGALSVSGTVPVSGLETSPVRVAIVVTGFDACGNMSTSADTVSVVDDTPPVIVCADSVTVECTGNGGTAADDPALADFFASVTASDNCDGEVEVTNDAPEIFPLGSTLVTFTAADAFGNESTCGATVIVEDTTPPVVSVSLNRNFLWPPNHKFFDIVASVDADDVCDTVVTVTLLSVTSDEPANGRGDGNTNPDIRGADIGEADTTFALRAERSGNGDGRTYTIIYQASDGSGNSAADTATVYVPHDQGGSAHASNGFDDDGGDVDGESDNILLVVASQRGGMDATRVDARGAQIGNIKGALYPAAAYRGDVDGDGLDDLVLAYRRTDAQALAESGRGKSDKTSFHYVSGDGSHYVVGDIFALGSPTRVDVSMLEPISLTDEVPASDDGPSTPSTAGGKALQQLRLAAYPNPFNPQTVVTYELNVAGPASVKIYDARGRYIDTLANGTASAGVHSVVWSGVDHRGQGVASGIYFLRLESANQVVTRKIVLLK